MPEEGVLLLGDLEVSCPTSYGQVLRVRNTFSVLDVFTGFLFIFVHYK